MKSPQQANAEQMQQAAAPLTASIQKVTSEATFVDNRPEAAAQRMRQEMKDNSPQAMQLKAYAEMMQCSPQAIAQRMFADRINQGRHGATQDSAQNAAPGGALQRVGDEELLQGKFTTVQLAEDEEPVQRQFASAAPAQMAGQENPKTNNTGLPDQIKSGIENLSGMSMDHVKVHYNSSQPAQLNAHAYAQGSDIHVAPGQEQHLPHEAWHVVQQAQGRVKPTMQMKGAAVNDDAGLEREADVMGARALGVGAAQRVKDDHVGTLEPASSSRGQQVTASTQGLADVPHTAQRMPIQLRLPPEQALKDTMHSDITVDFSNLDNPVVDVVKSADQDAHKDGLKTVIKRQLLELRGWNWNLGDDQPSMQPIWNAIKDKVGLNLSINSVIEKGHYSELITLSKAVTTQYAAVALGAPEDYMAPPKNVTDTANIGKLVTAASNLFDHVVDSDVNEIFGVPDAGTAKTKLQYGKAWMNYLHLNNKIVTDRSGYSLEVGLGGMSAAGQNILLPSSAIDNPDTPNAKATTFHEAMHSGNADVRDNGGYIGSPGFKERSKDLKLVNAAHYEMLAHRQLGTHGELAGAFVPPGGIAAGGGVVAAPTQTEQALNIVSEKFRKAWTMSLWLRDRFLNVYKTPALWTQAQNSGVLTNRSLPYWSKVEQLTVHNRPNIDATSADKAKAPVTQIDLALAESLSRCLMHGSRIVPATEADALKLAAVYPDGSNWNYVFNLDAEADALLRFLVSRLPISGDVDRDVKTVNELSSKGWADIDQNLDPAAY